MGLVILIVANFYYVLEILTFFWKNYKTYFLRLVPEMPGWMRQWFPSPNRSSEEPVKTFPVKFFTKNSFDSHDDLESSLRPEALRDEGYPQGYQSPKSTNTELQENYK